MRKTSLDTPKRAAEQHEQLKQTIIKALEDLKALDIKVLDVAEFTNVTDVIIIASGTSTRHVKSLASNVGVEVKKIDVQPLGTEGDDAGDWVLVDCADIIVHVMLPEVRALYDLEGLWSASGAATRHIDGLMPTREPR